MSQVSKDYNSINWCDIFVYDPTATPSCVRWKNDIRGGQYGGFLKAKEGTVAGSIHTRSNSHYTSVTVPHKRTNWNVGRVIWIMNNGYLPKEFVIDHIDGNPLNNNITNLRAVTQTHNNRNATIRKDNKTGTVGVSFNCCNITGITRVVGKWREDGKIQTRSFSVQKYGLLPAIEMAIAVRKTKLSDLNDIGYGYTDRHLQKEQTHE